MSVGTRGTGGARRNRARHSLAMLCLGVLVLAISFAYLDMLAQTAPRAAGLRIKTHYSSPLSGDTITYIENDRKRVEERRQFLQPLRPRGGGPVVYVTAPPIVTITRCDRNEIYTLSADAHEFTSRPIPKPPSKEQIEARSAALKKLVGEPPSTPTLLIETTTNDSGERKQMFGHTARHVITTVKQLPIGDSGTLPQENVTDGWYIDLDTSISCVPGAASFFAVLVGGAPRKPGERYLPPVPSYKNVGKPETGFAVETKRSHHLLDASGAILAGQRMLPADEMHVTEIATIPLDPALFEVPKSFRKVDRIQRAPVLTFWQRWLGWLGYYWMRLRDAL